MVIQTILEIIGAIFLIIAIFNEDKLVAFEEKVAERIKRRSAK